MFLIYQPKILSNRLSVFWKVWLQILKETVKVFYCFSLAMVRSSLCYFLLKTLKSMRNVLGCIPLKSFALLWKTLIQFKFQKAKHRNLHEIIFELLFPKLDYFWHILVGKVWIFQKHAFQMNEWIMRHRHYYWENSLCNNLTIHKHTFNIETSIWLHHIR